MLFRKAIALVFFVPAFFASSFQVHTAQFRAQVQGVVKEADTGKPLQGAKVYLIDPAREWPTANSEFAVANEMGEFAITINLPGAHRLFPTHPGFVYSRPARLQEPRAGVVVRVSEGVQAATLELQMAREGSITGLILDLATGDPIPNAIVTLALKSFSDSGNLVAGPVPRGAESGTIRTNDRGEYRFFGLQPGNYYVRLPASTGKTIRFYPGVEDLSKADLIRVEAGQETRVSPVLVESPDKTLRVTFHFSATGKALNQGVLRLPGSTAFTLVQRGLGTGLNERDLSLRLTRGRYDLNFQLQSRENDLFYARPQFEVGSEDVDVNVTLMPGIRVTGSLQFTDAGGQSRDTGGIRCLLVPRDDEGIGITPQLGPLGCLQGQVEPGRYLLEIPDAPLDAFVVSARSGDRDVLRDGLDIERDVSLDLKLSTPGAAIIGVVTNSKGERFSDATVALVPDVPYRDAIALYRTDVSTSDGSFELRGIAPGNYQLFAWSDLRGFAYRSAEFMKGYEGKGKPIKVEASGQISANLIALE